MKSKREIVSARKFLESKRIYNLDTTKRYNEVVSWMDEYALRLLSEKGWIDAKVETPEMIEGEDYSKNVLAYCNNRLMVMCYCYIDDGEDGGYAWTNCNGQIDGEGVFDENYEPTHWQHLPSIEHLKG